MTKDLLCIPASNAELVSQVKLVENSLVADGLSQSTLFTVDNNCATYTTTVPVDLPEGTVLQIVPENTLLTFASVSPFRNVVDCNNEQVVLKDSSTGQPNSVIETNDQNFIPNFGSEILNHSTPGHFTETEQLHSEGNISDFDLSFLTETDEPNSEIQGTIEIQSVDIVQGDRLSDNFCDLPSAVPNSRNFDIELAATECSNSEFESIPDSETCDTVVVDVSQPIQLSQNSLIVVNGQKCILQSDPQTGQVVAFPIKETDKPKKRRGRPKKREDGNRTETNEQNEESKQEESECISDDDSRSNEKGLLEIVTDEGALVRRSSRRRKRAKSLRDYETGNLVKELGSDVDDRVNPEIEHIKRKMKYKSPGRPRKLKRKANIGQEAKKRGRPRLYGAGHEPTQTFYITTADGQNFMAQLPLSFIPAGLSAQDIAKHINAWRLQAEANSAEQIGPVLSNKSALSSVLKVANTGPNAEASVVINSDCIMQEGSSLEKLPNSENQLDLTQNNDSLKDASKFTEPELTKLNRNDTSACLDINEIVSNMKDVVCELTSSTVNRMPTIDLDKSKANVQDEESRNKFENNEIQFLTVIEGDLNTDTLIQSSTSETFQSASVQVLETNAQIIVSNVSTMLSNDQCTNIEVIDQTASGNVETAVLLANDPIQSYCLAVKSLITNEARAENSRKTDQVSNNSFLMPVSTESDSCLKIMKSKKSKGGRPRKYKAPVTCNLDISDTDLQAITSVLGASPVSVSTKRSSNSSAPLIPLPDKLLSIILPKSGQDLKPLMTGTLELYKCTKCNFTSVYNFEYMQHLATHSDAKHCKSCEFLCLTEQEMIQHYKSQHPRCICIICNYYADQPYAIKRHMLRHEGKQCRCEICNKSYKDHYILKMHMKLVHLPADVLFKCQVCAKEFNRKAHLKRHLRTHDANKAHKCIYCDYKGSERSDITKHMLVHEDPKHICEYCGKMFRQTKNKELHLKRHRRQRDYKCGVCDYYGYTFTEIRKHIERRHKDAAVVLCDKCGQAFKTYTEIEEHQMSNQCQYFCLEQSCTEDIPNAEDITIEEVHGDDIDQMNEIEIKYQQTIPNELISSSEDDVQIVCETNLIKNETESDLDASADNSEKQIVINNFGQLLNSQNQSIVINALDTTELVSSADFEIIPSVSTSEKS